MSIQGQLYKSIKSMPGCIAGGYIDLDTGKLVSMLTMESQSKEVLERLVGITEDLFQGPNVVLIENIFKEARGITDTGSHLFQEMVVMNEDLMHIFVRGHGNKNHVITFVSKGSANMMSFLVNARAEVYKLEAALRADLEKSRNASG